MALYTETLAEWLDDGNALPEECAQLPGLENAFLGRYVTREIGFETPWLFKVKLNAKAAEIIPLYVGRAEALNTAEAAVLTGTKQSKTVNGKTRGTVTEMPINATTAQPNTVTQTDEAETRFETTGLTPDEAERAAEFFTKRRASLVGKCADEFNDLFMGVF